MAKARDNQFFILTGDPGVGKTTLTKKLAAIIFAKGVKVSGFYTEETRKNGVREGFDVVSLDGSRGRLAREQSLLTGPVKSKVGKYGVLVQEFEKIALPCLDKQDNTKSLLVIDEIGKMEFFSEPFKARVRNIFSHTSDHIVLATIPVRRSDPLIENIRNHTKAKVWMVTRENRNNIQEEILKEMKVTLSCVGKTTLTKKLAAIIFAKGVKVSGFYTEETRKNGVREGFDVVSLDGSRGRLAREQSLLTGPVKSKVGKYGVLVQEFEKIALPCLDKQDNTKSLLVIDEIGKMEFFSEPFKARVRNIFSHTSDHIVLATIPVRRSDPLIENIRNHTKAKVWMVTRENRNNIQEEILKEMKVTLSCN